MAGSTERADRSQRVADNALAAHLNLRQMQLAARDVRLARTPPTSKGPNADLQRLQGRPKHRHLDAALTSAAGAGDQGAAGAKSSP